MKTGRELAMLQDIISYFGEKPKQNRCISSNGRCQYKRTKNSIGCAIGMYLTDETANNLPNQSISILLRENRILLPKWMKKMDVYFLQDCQELHDNGFNWNEKGKGLSKEGLYSVMEICTNHCIPFEELKF